MNDLMSKIKVSDYVINFISLLKAKHIFMLPGGGCMHLVDSVGKNKKLRYVACLHEQAASIAANGYAQYINDIGLILVTTGPGGTNAITGVAASWIDSTPLLVISGQVKRKDMLIDKGLRQMGVQEVDIISIVKPITKYAVTILEPESARYHLEKAVYIARQGRPGPVWIDIPLDVQAAVVTTKNLKGFNPVKEEKKINKNLKRQVSETITLLNNSERPVILAGAGIRLAGAEEEFLKLVRHLGVPVLTTWRLADILSEDDEVYFGRPGSIASRYANFIQQNSDFLLVIGARLDLPQTGFNHYNFARSARKVIVDIDEAELKKLKIKVDVPVISDAKDFLKEFLNKLNLLKKKDRSMWFKQCVEWKKRYPVILPQYLKIGKYVNTYALVDVLSELLEKNDVIVPGSSGACSEITYQAFRVKKGQRVINSPGLGSMGFGLPQSIGVSLASKKRTICILGDGGLQHNIQELETLRRLDLPIKIFVLNNNGYGSIRNTHKKFFGGRLVACDPSSGLTLPDTCRIAAAYGINTSRIYSQKDLKAEIVKILKTDGPYICDVMIDPDLQTAPRLSSAVKPNGSIVSKPLEDLWPFLDRDEFKENMIVKSIRE